MKKYAVIVAINLLLPGGLCLFGQKSTIDYDLSSYELPELKRHYLELQFFVNQDHSYTNNRSDFDTNHIHNTNFSLNFNPTYSYYLNTKKLQIESYASARPFDFNYSRNYSETNTYKHTEFDPSFNYSGQHRFYLKGKFFIEADVNAGIRYNYENFQETEETNNTFNNYASIPILVGYGRIERVEDARLAVYILDDLKKHNRLNKDLSQEEITAFAQYISKLMNERFFDDREKNIWAIQQIDSFMIANQLLSQSDALSISLINDNWNYADLPFRESGFRISGGIGNGIDNSHNKNEYELEENNYEYNTFNYNLYLTGNFMYEKPINLYWQFSFSDILGAGQSFQFSNNIQNDIENKSDVRVYRISNSFSPGLGYYPNSRTEIKLNLNLETIYDYRVNKSENVNTDYDESNNFIFSTGLRLTGYYYFSPQLRMTLNTGFNHYFSKYESENPIENSTFLNNSGDLYFNLGFTYKIL